VFGVVRTIWALMVMIEHLFYPDILGRYAVFGFYILSGYLMTLIMHETYGFHKEGRIKFIMNRFLRLYPMYWVAALFTLVLIYFVGAGVVKEFHESMFTPTDLKSALGNAMIIFPSWYPARVNPRLVPQAWALTVEIFFYALICVGVSKTFFRTTAWFILSLMYVGFTFFAGEFSVDRYFSIAAASLPFSIGGLLYFFSKNAKSRSFFMKFKLSTNILLAVMIINVIAWILVHREFLIGMQRESKFVEIGFYLNILICSVLIFSIIMGGKVAFVGRRGDKFIGDLSYPIYLMQWQVGLLVSFLLFGTPFHGFAPQGLESLIVSIFVVFVLSIAVVYLLDRPVQTVRNKIKASLTRERGQTIRSSGKD
jgi:peptidoglycan/LPS O-acetylase OafA/YrhL